jgi:hypothetical protein
LSSTDGATLLSFERKPDQIREVFDSSAIFEGVSLNSLLMSGPDLTNKLVGVLMRFRKNAVAITSDVEQMFYQFRVTENHKTVSSYSRRRSVPKHMRCHTIFNERFRKVIVLIPKEF